MKNVKIQITTDVPVDPKHGLTIGRVLKAIRHGTLVASTRLWTVISDAEEEVVVTSDEAHEIREE